jgi:hypothetical protein
MHSASTWKLAAYLISCWSDNGLTYGGAEEYTNSTTAGPRGVLESHSNRASCMLLLLSPPSSYTPCTLIIAFHLPKPTNWPDISGTLYITLEDTFQIAYYQKQQLPSIGPRNRAVALTAQLRKWTYRMLNWKSPRSRIFRPQ